MLKQIKRTLVNTTSFLYFGHIFSSAQNSLGQNRKKPQLSAITPLVLALFHSCLGVLVNALQEFIKIWEKLN